MGLFDPGGLDITSFKAPTEEELAHDFLWRVERRAPAPGMIAIFDRSHYEDVLVARVHGLASEEDVERRYDAINEFEGRLAGQGTTIVKCMLHISMETQKERLLARLDDPTKQWKYKPGDVDERMLWPKYREAYEIALERCNTESAPWYVVPSDRKWYRNWAVGALLRETMRAMDLTWPEVDYDLATERRRLEAS
jgi:PPK2 family polyphosphate:nucleotide phosphotransferase